MGIMEPRRGLPREEVDLATFHAVDRFLKRLEQEMDQRGVSHNELARRMGRTYGRVSQIFNGGDDMQISTLVRMALALGGEIEVRIRIMEEM